MASKPNIKKSYTLFPNFIFWLFKIYAFTLPSCKITTEAFYLVKY
jgi:hypothetical protein